MPVMSEGGGFSADDACQVQDRRCLVHTSPVGDFRQRRGVEAARHVTRTWQTATAQVRIFGATDTAKLGLRTCQPCNDSNLD